MWRLAVLPAVLAAQVAWPVPTVHAPGGPARAGHLSRDGPLVAPTKPFVVAGGEGLYFTDDTATVAKPATLTPVHDEGGLSSPAVLADGSFLVVDTERSRVLRISPAGVRTVVAGTGRQGHGRDGVPAVASRLDGPAAVAAYRGGFLISDEYNFRVRWVRPDGVITTVAGNGKDIGPESGGGPTGDGGPAVSARVSRPEALAVLPDGGFVVADLYTVRRVSPDGIITRIAGTGEWGDTGDGGPATAATLFVSALAVASDGSVLIGGGARVRRVAADGTISTVAGADPGRGSGDGGPASAARFAGVAGVLALADGGFLVTDPYAHAVRRVSGEGIVSTLVDSPAFRDFAGREAYLGDSGPGVPSGIAASPDGLLLTSGDAVLLARGAASARPAVRIVAARVRRARVVLTVDTSTDATITVEQRDYRRRLARSAARTVPAGRRRVTLTTRLGATPLDTYAVRVVARGPSGTAADQVRLALGGGLSLDLVSAVLYDELHSDVLYLGPCARMATLRVDCAVMARPRRCAYEIAVVRRTDGLLWKRTYRCRSRHARPFQRDPRYTSAATLLPSSDYY